MMKIALFIISCFNFFISSCVADEKVEALKKWVCDNLPSIQGWCSKEKATEFIDLVMQEKPSVCVEIGVFCGASVFPVASALKFVGKGVIVAVDPWDKIESIRHYDHETEMIHLDWWAKLDFVTLYQSYLAMLKKNDLEKYCITMKMPSEKAVEEIDKIDILYIDNSTSEARSLKDVTLYLPKVKQGGYVWLSDCSFFSTQNSIDHLLKCCDVIKIIDDGNCILFKKR